MPGASPQYVQFRENEQRLLSSFITPHAEALAANVIVLGYRSVGKTRMVKQHLDNLGIRRTLINCDKSITQKILLQNCLHQIRADSGVDLTVYKQQFMYKGLEAARPALLCETFAHFLEALEQFVVETGYCEPHVLVLDRFDQCLEPTDGLFRSFARFREYSTVRNISVIYVISHEEPELVATLGIPHVRLAPYTLEQTADVIVQAPHADVYEGLVDASFWTKFARLVVDLYFDYTGSDLSLLGDICQNLWPKFRTHHDSMDPSERDFVAIYRAVRDDLVQDDVVGNSTVKMYGTADLEKETAVPLSDLPLHSKFILIAAYLASHTDPRNDVQVYSKVKSPKKRLPRKSTADSLTKANIDSRLLSAAFFDLERMKAILSVIYRSESQTLSRANQEYFMHNELSERDLARKEKEFNSFTLNRSVDTNTQVATLIGLGHIVRTYSKDPLSNKIRWKCNVSWDVIDGLAREIGFPLLNYSVDVQNV